MARKPAISAVAMRQSPRPSGAKTGAIQPDTMASMLCSGLSARAKVGLKLCRNQTAMVAMKMMLKARLKKSLVLSQMRRPTLLALGIR